jgi:ribonuclease VapC
LIVIDTSCLMAILLKEEEADVFVQRLVASKPVIAAPILFELLMVSHGKLGNDGAPQARALLKDLSVDVVEWTSALSDAAFEAFTRFGKGQHPAKLNFGDCISYALAKSLDVPLLFKGDDFSKTDIRAAV